MSIITWQVMAVCGFPSPSIISANPYQLLLDLRISPSSPQSLQSSGSPRQLPAVPSIPFIFGINLQLVEANGIPFSFLISAKPWHLLLAHGSPSDNVWRNMAVMWKLVNMWKLITIMLFIPKKHR